MNISADQWKSPTRGSPTTTTTQKSEATSLADQLKKERETMCQILNISEQGELIPSLQNMTAIVKAVPRMEKFICEICDICRKGTMDLGHDIELNPKVIAPLLNYWIEKLRDTQEMEKEISLLLNKRHGVAALIDPLDPDFKELKQQFITAIGELVNYENTKNQ